MERFPGEPVEPFDIYITRVTFGQMHSFESDTQFYVTRAAETAPVSFATEPSPEGPLHGPAPVESATSTAAAPQDFGIVLYPYSFGRGAMRDLERFAGLMTEVILDVALPFDWPRSPMTLTPGADINNPATEPNRKPSWHEYFESGPPSIDFMF